MCLLTRPKIALIKELDDILLVQAILWTRFNGFDHSLLVTTKSTMDASSVTHYITIAGTKSPERLRPINQVRSLWLGWEESTVTSFLLFAVCWYDVGGDNVLLWNLSLRRDKYPVCTCHCVAAPNTRVKGVIVKLRRGLRGLYGESLTTKWCWWSLSGTEYLKVNTKQLTLKTKESRAIKSVFLCENLCTFHYRLLLKLL